MPRPTLVLWLRPWRESRDDAVTAYRQWCAAPQARRAEAYAVYRAAEQREAAAAADLDRRTARGGRLG